MWPNFTRYAISTPSSPRRRGPSDKQFTAVQSRACRGTRRAHTENGDTLTGWVPACAGTTGIYTVVLALVFIAAVLPGCASTPQQESTLTPAIDSATPASKPAPRDVDRDFRSAIALMQAEDWRAAAERLEAITMAQPGLSGPWVNLGIARVKLGDSSGAEQAFKKAIEVNSQQAEARNQLGIIYRRSGRLDEAQSIYNEALKYDPGHADAHWNLAILHDRYLPDPALALAHYEQYQQLTQSDDAQLQQWIARLREQLPQAVEMTAGVSK
jgi:tetratricopeptide (TPR) repeat protein